MSSAMLLERSSAGAGTLGQSSAPGALPASANWCVLPRCTFKCEKTKDGFKLWCKCDDDVACGTLQNLCKMLCDQTCSVSCTLNGIQVCQCNLTCGVCKCEYTKDGVCISCHSGDKTCCEVVQGCCECLASCLKAGCCCYVSFGGTPVCCGTC